MGFPCGSDGKESACNARDLDSIPGSGQSPLEWHGYPLQYSCLENSMDRGAWWGTVHGITKNQTGLRDNKKTNKQTNKQTNTQRWDITFTPKVNG